LIQLVTSFESHLQHIAARAMSFKFNFGSAGGGSGTEQRDQPLPERQQRAPAQEYVPGGQVRGNVRAARSNSSHRRRPIC
jgi:hypothetical protein